MGLGLFLGGFESGATVLTILVAGLILQAAAGPGAPGDLASAMLEKRVDRVSLRGEHRPQTLTASGRYVLVVRAESDGQLRRYVHVGTGNYHPTTARLYTDFGLLTSNAEIGDDVNEVFKQLTGLGKAHKLKHLWQAPFTRSTTRASRCTSVKY